MSQIATLPAPKILLMGESGTGKTYCLRTLLDAGIEPFAIFTEPGMETLGDLGDRLHWSYVPPTAPKWSALSTMVKNVNSLSYENQLKIADPNKQTYNHFFEVLKLCENFIDQNGQSFGDVTTWGTNRALILDSLSGLSDMAMQMVSGMKAARAQHEWGGAMQLIEVVLNKLTTDCRCWMILTGHIEREVDEVTGGTRVMVSTLGKKLAPRIPRYFSDVIQTVREGATFTWDTAAFNTTTKSRNLPIASKLQPSFLPLVEEWKKRGGKIEPAQSK